MIIDKQIEEPKRTQVDFNVEEEADQHTSEKKNIFSIGNEEGGDEEEEK